LVYSRERFQEGRDIPSVRKKDKVIISYIGKLFWDRNLRDVIKAISLIKKDNEELLKRLLIRVVGEATPQDVRMIHDNRCEEFFELIPFQDKNSIKNFYLESDAFLLIESQQNENVFFPSKLLAYFLYQRPIIGITPQKGETTDLLNESGNIAIRNGDVVELKNALLRLLGGELPNFDKNFYLRYSQESLRIQYNEVLKSVL
jgi:glycosyltransferase involved in cell wall biosynthesis